jgi:hypothetical protein
MFAADPNGLAVEVLREVCLGLVSFYFDDDVGKGCHTLDNLTSANAPVTRMMDKGTEVIGPQGA